MAVMRYLMFLVFLSNCAYHFHEDKSLFKLAEKEKSLYDSKKIIYIGFDYIERRWVPVPSILHQEKDITNKTHLKIIEFVNSEYLSKKKDSFQKNYRINRGKGGGADLIDEGYFNEGRKFSTLGLNQIELKKFEGLNSKIIEKNLKTFLLNYLSTTKHLGLDKMESILDVKGNSVKFKLKDFDYIFVCIGELFPDDDYNLNFYIYDSQLNLIKTINNFDKVKAFEEFEQKAFDKSIVPFLQKSVTEIR